MEQKTLIALYGKKESQVEKYLIALQEMISDSLPAKSITPYPIEQIHGTIIGLESLKIDQLECNRNIWEKERKKSIMNLKEAEKIIDRYLPFQIRFGGFLPDSRTFLSRGEIPYKRSFRLDRVSKRLILIGWPHRQGSFSQPWLRDFREEMEEKCNVAHKYMNDNDFYMVLGELKGSVEMLPEFENRVRDYLRVNPIDVSVEELFTASYSDTRLPLASTKIGPLIS